MPLKKNFILPFLILFLCLPACANKPINNGLGNENPFVATGLLAHPNETAEEILLRAHSNDPEAATLAIAGYIMGVGGFPKNGYLGEMYYLSGQPAGLSNTSELLRLMNFHAGINSFDKPNSYKCYDASRSFAAPLFKQAGIFDLDSLCAELGYDDTISIFNSNVFYDELKEIVVELINRPMTKQDVEILNKQKKFLPDTVNEFIGYQIAIAGNKNASSQEKQLNLLRFIEQRKAESFPESAEMRDLAVNALMQLSAGDVYMPAALEIVRKAHQGDPVAARQMAENYRTGAMGFPKNPALVYPWLQQAIVVGDKKALNSYVLAHYMDGLLKYAWVYAQVGLHCGDQENSDVFSWVVLEAEKSFTFNEIKSFQTELDEELEHMKALGPQIK